MQIYSEPALLGEQGYTLGPVFLILAVLILVASPRRVVPRRIDGSRTRALASGPVVLKDGQEVARVVRPENAGEIRDAFAQIAPPG